MKEKDVFALVPRPPGTLEKAEPGRKRILSGMVADTLALAKKRPPRKSRPLRIVSVDDEDWRLGLVEMVISRFFKDVTVQSFRDAEEAWQELSRTDPDLLITDDLMSNLNGDEIVRRLADRKVAYPIIVIQGYPERDQWVLDCAGRGENVTLLRVPCDLESFVRALESGLRISRDAKGPVEIATQPRKTRPLKIFLVNDNPPVLQGVETMIRHWSEEAALLLFQDAAEAWQALSESNPDLLIWVVSAPLLRGKETIQRLLNQKVTYPIIVMSAYDPDGLWVQEFAGRGLNVSFLPMPFTFDDFRKRLDAGLRTAIGKP